MNLTDIKNAFVRNEDVSNINEMYKEVLENIDEKSQLEVWKQVCGFANVDMIAHLISIGWQPMRVEDDYRNTPLHFLASAPFSRDYTIPEGKVYETTKLLLSERVSGLKKNEYGETAIMFAAKVGYSEMLKAYQEAGVKTSFTDKEGNTLLHILAKESGHHTSKVNMAKVDLDKNLNDPSFDANMNYQVKRRAELELKYSKVQGQLTNFEAFAYTCLEFGQDPYIKNGVSETAIDVAVRYKSKTVGAILKGYDLNDKENAPLYIKSGGQDIYQACINKDAEALEALIQLGENVNNEYDKEGAKFKGLTPLSISMTMHDADCVDLLLKNGADAMLNDSKSWHPFMYLYTPNSSVNTSLQQFENKSFQKTLSSFLDADFDIDSLLDDEENTLLTISAKFAPSLRLYNSNSVAKTMIEEAIFANADVNKTNREGISALMYLCLTTSDRGERELVTLLEQGASTELQDKNGKTALIYAVSNKDKTSAKNYCELLEQFGELLIDTKDNSGKSALDYAVELDNENLVAWLLEKQ